ncbi:hypothetical protein DID76_02675 [Candidatus Marinamargulisbacteria bacterium SCGC AG-414-C22]|nr:hypothetical protein DID76_02675 [Candidatus Marinamargulisbacteria bacterium SCGC AG-414-C22]
MHNRDPKLEEQFNGVKLGGWVEKQRQNYNQGTLEESKIELLKQAGFVWSISELVWQTNFGLYIQFKEIYNREPQSRGQFEGVNLGDNYSARK